MFCSVIIPLYNKAAYIEEALRSVLNQSHADFEVIVIDDGSKDDGPARVLSFNDDRILLVRQQNSGVSNARNRGIELSKGELICFLDGDDWYRPTYLATVVAMATAHPNIGLFATAFRRSNFQDENDVTSEIGESGVCERIDDLFARWRESGAFFFTGSIAVRRSLLISLSPLFPVGESMGEDLDLWFRLAEISPMLFCSVPLVGYRVDVATSLCASNPVTVLLPVFQRVAIRARGTSMPAPLRASALRLVLGMQMTLARSALLQGQRLSCLTQLIAIPTGIWTKRWWAILLLCLLIPSPLVRHWANWRTRLAQSS